MGARMATPSSQSSASPESARPRSGTTRSRVRAPGARRCWQRGRPSPRRGSRSPGSPICWRASRRSSTRRFRTCNARRSRWRCCERRRGGRQDPGCWGPPSSRSSGSSPTSGPSSLPSTTSTGSIVRRRRRSSSRCGACPTSGCGRSSLSARVKPAPWPGSSATAPWPGSSSVHSRLPPCTASSRHSSAGRSPVRRSCGSRRHPAGTRCTRSRSPGCSNGRATGTLLVSQSPRASRRWSRRGFALCRPRRVTRSCAPLRSPNPTFAWCRRRRSPRPRTLGSSGSGSASGSRSSIRCSLRPSTRPPRLVAGVPRTGRSQMRCGTRRSGHGISRSRAMGRTSRLRRPSRQRPASPGFGELPTARRN